MSFITTKNDNSSAFGGADDNGTNEFTTIQQQYNTSHFNDSREWLSSIADDNYYEDMEYPFCESPTPTSHILKSCDTFTQIDPLIHLQTDLPSCDNCSDTDDSMFDGNNQPLNCQNHHSIPFHNSSKDAIKRITPSTLISLLQGKYGIETSLNSIIIDCRFPYEYVGGHIPGAVNVDPSNDVKGIMFDSKLNPTISSDRIIIFHCEFSSERAPKMALELRNTDRLLNASHYPHLHYPNIYILDGGYKAFFEGNPSLCNPPNQYVPMRCLGKEQELKHHLCLGKNIENGHGVEGVGRFCATNFNDESLLYTNSQSISRKPSPVPFDTFLSSDINIDPSEYRQFSLAVEAMFTGL